MKTARPIRFLHAFFTVSGFTLISRVLGFVRDQMLAAIIGPGATLDAWFAAFRLPNMFRRTFADGAMSAAFVPLFKGRLENAGEAKAKAFASGIFTLLLLILAPLIALLILFMPQVMGLLTEFEPESQTFELAVIFGRIMIPYLLLMTLLALIGAILDALGRFGPKAIAPSMLNVILVLALIGVAQFDWAAGAILAWSTLIAGFAQLFIVLIPAAAMGWLPRLNFNFRPGPFLTKMGNGIIANGGGQISSLIVMVLATSQAGDFSRLNFADRLYQLPIGLIGVALTTVLLSSLTGLVARGESTHHQMDRSFDLAWLLSIPMALACAFHAEFLFQGLFQVGRFTAIDTAIAGLALTGYAIGIPAAVGQKILQPLFFAHQDYRNPMVHTLTGMAVAVALAFALYPSFGIFGIALATSVASWTGFLSLSVHGHMLGLYRMGRGTILHLFPMGAAGLLMVLILSGILRLIGDLTILTFWLRLPMTLGLIALAGAIYFALAYAFGAIDMSNLRALRRQS